MFFRTRAVRMASLICIAYCLSACANGALPPTQVSDPFEPVNRTTFAVNTVFNQAVTIPLSQGIAIIVPSPARQAIANGTSNLNEPTVFVNNVLQGRFSASATTFSRFVVNSTVGIGGLFDVATLAELPKQSGDFGQTLFVWGVADSPFFILPLLGPSTVRDAVGYGVDSVASPGGYAVYRVGGRIAVSAISGLDALQRSRDLQTVDETAIDPYVRLRSVYYQNRRRELLDGLGRKNDVFDPMISDGSLANSAPRGRR